MFIALFGLLLAAAVIGGLVGTAIGYVWSDNRRAAAREDLEALTFGKLPPDGAEGFLAGAQIRSAGVEYINTGGPLGCAFRPIESAEGQRCLRGSVDTVKLDTVSQSYESFLAGEDWRGWME